MIGHLPEAATADINLLQESPSRTTHLLVICQDPWWVRSLESIFSPFSYSIHCVTGGEKALEYLAEARPDAVIVHAGASDRPAAEVVQQVTGQGLDVASPILVVSDGTLRRDERIAALKAGAWECMNAPIDAGELLLKMEAFMRAKRHADQARARALTDHETGLYSIHGILRWLRELGNTAQRYHRPLGCAVFTPVVSSKAEAGEAAASRLQIESVASLLAAHARTSDVVGRLNQKEFIVLAPETDRDGVIRMAERFVNASEERWSKSPSRSPRGGLLAGCYAVPDLDAAAIQPVEVIVRATLALRSIQSDDSAGAVEFFRSPVSRN